MRFLRSESVFFFLVAKCHLKSTVTIIVHGLHLRYYTGTGLNNGTRGLLAARIEDGGHPDFFTNDSFHVLTVFPRKVVQDITPNSGFNPGSSSDLFFYAPKLQRRCALHLEASVSVLDVHLRFRYGG
jgi:hypothetical protein